MSSAQCIECDEIITNPICTECLADQMKIMLDEHDPSLAATITGFYVEGETFCIKCQNQTGLCAHCFCRDVYEHVKENDEDLAEEFMARFDFDLRRAML